MIPPPLRPTKPRGVLYVATGARYVEEAEISARSLKRLHPDLPTLLHTDRDVRAGAVFDEVVRLTEATRGFMDKIGPLLESPFERTVFLDTDTFVCGRIDALFAVLDRFDVAAAHAPMRTDAPTRTPDAFPELNTGVLAYRRNPEVDSLFSAWRDGYAASLSEPANTDSDQPAFRHALYESRLRFCCLPPEYNFRSVMPAAAGRMKIRIIHGRTPDFDALAATVNRSRNIRVFLPGLLELGPKHFSVLSRAARPVAAAAGAAASLAAAALRLAGRRPR